MPGKKPSIDAINALLPQTQCTRCGYPDCKSYAAALQQGEALHNQCPPGGPETISALGQLLGQDPDLKLNPNNGAHSPKQLAIIDESLCIGCVKCIKACPVDAIIGATKKMHTVIASECTGCELCIAPCPMDCIALVPAAKPLQALEPEKYKQRYQDRTARLEKQRLQKLTQRRQAQTQDQSQQSEQKKARQAYIQAAVERVKAKRNSKK